MTEPDSIPPRLRRAFADLAGPPPPVPASVDQALRRDASVRLRPRATGLDRPWRWLPLAAAAAALLVWLLLPPRALPGDLDHGDLDHNGRIDIRDAFALARQLRSGAAVDPGCDLTGEGVVDDADVRALAQRAVALEAGR